MLLATCLSLFMTVGTIGDHKSPRIQRACIKPRSTYYVTFWRSFWVFLGKRTISFSIHWATRVKLTYIKYTLKYNLKITFFVQWLNKVYKNTLSINNQWTSHDCSFGSHLHLFMEPTRLLCKSCQVKSSNDAMVCNTRDSPRDINGDANQIARCLSQPHD